MRKEYNLKSMKVKRRGILPELKKQQDRQPKVRITIAVDLDIVEYFKRASKENGALPYQTQINQVLRKVMDSGPLDNIENIKAKLIDDPEFIRRVAKSIKIA